MSLADAEHAIREGLDAPTLDKNGEATSFLANVLARRIERDQDLALEAIAGAGGAVGSRGDPAVPLRPTTPTSAPRRSRRSTRWAIGTWAGR